MACWLGGNQGSLGNRDEGIVWGEGNQLIFQNYPPIHTMDFRRTFSYLIEIGLSHSLQHNQIAIDQQRGPFIFFASQILRKMYRSQNIKQTFTKMILFNGKLAYNPNTLNNRVHTYFLAHEWQQANLKELGLLPSIASKVISDAEQPQYTHQKWMQLVQSVSNFNTTMKNLFDIPMMKAGCSLFYDWSVYGDMMLLPEYRAVAFFDDEKANPIVTVEEYTQNSAHPMKDFMITKKMGEDKGVMAIIDQDAEDAYKTFSLALKLGPNYKVRFEPAVSRNISKRIINQGQDFLASPTSQQTEWWFAGNVEKMIEKDLTSENAVVKEILTNFLGLKDMPESEKINQRLFLKELQYRYNHNTKISQIKGYVAKNENFSNDLNMQGWRTIRTPETGVATNGVFGNFVHFRAVKRQHLGLQDGILLDLSSAIPEFNDCTKHTPIYPQHVYFNFTRPDKTEITSFCLAQAQIAQILQKQAGYFFLQINPDLFSDLVSVTITLDSSRIKQSKTTTPYCQKGTEFAYMINFQNACIKSEIQKDVPLSQSNYRNQAKLKVHCSHKGKPFTGSITISLSSVAPVNSDSIEQYQEKHIEQTLQAFSQKVNGLCDDQKKNLVTKYGDENGFVTVDSIKKKVYQGDEKFKMIHGVSDGLVNGRISIRKPIDKPSPQVTQKPYQNQVSSYKWVKKNNPSETFQLVFSNNGSKQMPVDFVNGEAQVCVRLDEPLNSENNPRSPYIQSLAIMGEMKVLGVATTDKSNDTFFFAIFYQIESCNKNITLVDWVHSVAPTLKKMGLLYPSMQKIINLYSFPTMAMKAMRRAFDVEDENHPRYMPSTRELSQLEHRQIRRWLYDPHFNISDKTRMRKILQKSSLIESACGRTDCKISTVEDFKNLKKCLLTRLKNAFTVELTTIPLYLTAMFTVSVDRTNVGEFSGDEIADRTRLNEKSESLLRSVAIDEMKHLFIVSNLINALSSPEQSEQSSNIPYLDKSQIPTYLPENPGADPDQLRRSMTGVLQISSDFSSEYRKYFQTFFALPYSPEQLLKFVAIELPGETDDLEFVYDSDSYEQVTNGLDFTIKSRVEKLNGLIKAVNHERTLHPKTFLTIGDFYSGILDSLWDLSDLEQILNKKPNGEKVNLFSGDPDKQFTYFNLEDMSEIYDLRSAINQIRLIVEEGEGANLFTLDGDINKQSHFFKFLELYTRGKVQIPERYPLDGKIKINIKASNELGYIGDNYNKLYTHQWMDAQRTKRNRNQADDEFCEESSTISFKGKKQYPDIYSIYGFTNAYEKILEEFNMIFNISFNQFKQIGTEQNPDFVNLSESIQRREYQVWRRKRMENSIAKMRQMTIHADRNIHPSFAKNPALDVDPVIGLGPDYEVQLETSKSVECPVTGPKARNKK